MVDGEGDDVIVGEDDDLVDTATSSPEPETKLEDIEPPAAANVREIESKETDKPPEWVEWRETSDSGDPSDVLPNGELQVVSLDETKPFPSSTDILANNNEVASGPSAVSEDETLSSVLPEPAESKGKETPVSDSTPADNKTTAVENEASPEASAEADDKKENEVEGN